MSVDPSLLLEELAYALGGRVRRFDADWLAECDSTNAVLMARGEAGAPSGSVVVATRQTAGRGRRGRSWIAAPDDSLTFSLLWRFAPGTSPAGLSLAVGLAVARALDAVCGGAGCDQQDGGEKVGADEAPALQGGRANDALMKPLCSRAGNQATLASPLRILAVADDSTALKWPNDLLRNSRKLGGILVELLPGAPHAAVIGIGINRRLPATMPTEVRDASAALDCDVSAPRLLAAILTELLDVLERFAAAGFAALRPAWSARHAYEAQPVRLLSDFAPPREGICRGVDSDGALLLEVDGQVERVLSGEVSLRPAV
jgi:BirA family biotin operon repressor/biotin-[acetyl-CoA-carboxylase] ligase